MSRIAEMQRPIIKQGPGRRQKESELHSVHCSLLPGGGCKGASFLKLRPPGLPSHDGLRSQSEG